MTSKSHIVVAILATTAYAEFANIELVQAVPAYLMSFFFSLVPDIEEPNSYIGRKLPFISIPLKHIFRVKHRGVTHSVVVPALIFGVVLSIIGLKSESNIYLLVVGALIGWVSHIILDFFSDGGVELFWPISNSRFRLLPYVLQVKTGGIFEYLFLLPALTLLTIYILGA